MAESSSKPNEQPSFTDKLAVYQKALEEEFKLVESASEGENLPDMAKFARSLYIKAFPRAIQKMIALMEIADSESVQYNAAKHVIEQVLGDKGFAKAADPMQALMEAIQGMPEPTTAQMKEELPKEGTAVPSDNSEEGE